MNPKVRIFSVLVCISLVGVLTHLVPHDMGVSTVGAIGMLAAAYLPRSFMLVPVLITILIFDALNGFYGALGMSFVYLGHLAAALAARPLLRRVNPQAIVLAAIANAFIFYLVSNLTPMSLGFYPATPDGWLTCYINGLPFLLKGILANLVFGGIAFGAIWLARTGLNRGYGAGRFAASERN